GRLDPGELCDGAPPAGQSCLDYGFDAGRLACSSTCGLSLAGCRRIGWVQVHGPGNGRLTAVWGSSSSGVYAGAGHSSQMMFGKLFHFDGTTWMSEGASSPQIAFGGAVWGSGPSDVWVSTGISLVHYDGMAWTMSSMEQVQSIWGSARDDVYFGGNGQ